MDDLKLAKELYEDAIEATRDQRQQIEEDLRFSDPSNPEQWDEKVKRSRENDPGGARPCLVMDHTGQYVANVAGQVTKNPPAIHTVPVGSGADVKVSEQIDGILRHIEYASRAQTHYGIALTSAARAGVGYLIARPHVTDRGLNYQEPRISSQADPLRIVFDPWSVALDGSDADFGYELTSLSMREFKRRWPKAEKVSFGADSRTRTSRDDDKSIIIAEQWHKVEKTRNVIAYWDAAGELVSSGEDDYHAACMAAGATLPVKSTELEKYLCVHWRTWSGAEMLDSAKKKNDDGTEEEDYYPADSIGIVPVYGYWGIKDGRLTYCGIPRRAMNPQRAYNYHMSEQLAYMATAPKSPWLASARAIRGFEPLWERAAVESRAVLPYNDVDDKDTPIAAPQRPNVSVNLQNHIQGAQQALTDIEASIGMYRANLGAPSNETSGVAIDARKEQGEAATAHFPQNLSASLGQLGRVCLQMIPKLIDTKRQQRILGIDLKPSVVTVDPKAEKAIQKDQQGATIINPNVGKYDVRVVVGASYSTQRSQAQEALSSVMQANPALTSAIGPLWAQTLDIPNADKLAQVLTAMAPPAVQAILSPEDANTPKPEQLMQQNQQLQQQIQMMEEAGTKLQNEVQELRAKTKTEHGKLLIEGFKADTERLQMIGPALTPEAIQAIVAQTVQSVLSQPSPVMPPEPEPPMQQPMQQPEMQQQPSPPDAGFSMPGEGAMQ